jgi:Zn-finger nucleic acid-binding protein
VVEAKPFVGIFMSNSQNRSNNGVVCPYCQKKTDAYSPFPNLEISACRECGNGWFDKGKLAHALRTSTDTPPDASRFIEPDNTQSAQRLACPRCPDSRLFQWKCRSIEFHRCEKCGGILLPLKHMRDLRSLFPEPKSSLPKSVAPQTISCNAVSTPQNSESPADSPILRIVAIPVALFIGYVFTLSHGLSILAWFFSIIFHEIGHAAPAWISGFSAIPIPFGFCWVANDRSSLIIIFFIMLWSTGIFLAIKWKSIILSILFAGLLFLQFKMSFFISTDRAKEIWIASGQGGELVLGAVLVAAFVYPLPKQLRWDFWRFPALAAGGLLFTSSFLKWFKVSKGQGEIPWGSAMGGEGRDGDLERLHDIYGWSTDLITKNYYLIAKICLAWIALHYIVGIFSCSVAVPVSVNRTRI